MKNDRICRMVKSYT